MCRGTRVIVTDILTDPLWENYREVANGLDCGRAGRRRSFAAAKGAGFVCDVLYAEPRAPRDEELRLTIETAADLARIAIEQQRRIRRCSTARRAFGQSLRAIPDWMFSSTEGVLPRLSRKDDSKLHVPPSAFLNRNIREVLPPAVAGRWRRRSHASTIGRGRKSRVRLASTTPSDSMRRASFAVTATRFSASSKTSPPASMRSWKPTLTAVSWRT